MRLAPCRIVAVLLLTAGAAPAAGPVVAVLDPAQSDRATLLEAALLTEPGVTLVERAAVAAVLKEQELAAAFGPRGVSDRVRLGNVLKADILILVRPVAGTTPPALEVVVSETAGGLRLRAGAVPVTADPKADAGALEAVVRAGLTKHAERVRDVVAVPPFVSRDLALDHDHLKGAFARLAEGEALGRPGVVVVEFAEAEAVAKELALAAPGAVVNRPPPLYLLGEYRHDGKPGERRVTLTLRAERGGKPVGSPATTVVGPDAAAGAVRAWAAGVLDGAAGGPRPAADPKAEAKRLAARAGEFFRLGLWAEAVALMEASLLLDPDQSGLHRDAVEAVAARLRQFGRRTGTDPAVAREAHALYRRGVDHLAGHVRTNTKPAQSHRVSQLSGTLSHSINGLDIHPNTPPEVAAVVRETVEYQRAVLGPLALSPFTEAGGSAFYRFAVEALPPVDRPAFKLALALRVAKLPTNNDRWVLYDLIANPGAAGPDPAAHRAFLDRLAAAGDAKTKKLVAEHLAALDRDAKRVPGSPTVDQVPPKPEALGQDPKAVWFTPVAVTVDGRQGVPAQLLGVVAAGPGADLFWDHRGTLFLMTTKGVLRPIWTGPFAAADGPGPGHRVRSACFDGRLAWVAVENTDWDGAARRADGRRGESLSLLAVDPASGKVWPVTAADGLPEPPAGAWGTGQVAPGLWVVPLGPGRAAVVGTFGVALHRTWVGVATADPATGKTAVEVVHEAREPQADGKGQGQKPTIAFEPHLVAALRDGANARIFLGRGDSGPKFGLRPLLVDPAARTATAAPFPLCGQSPTSGSGESRADDGGAAVFLEQRLTRPDGWEVVRVPFPGTAREVVAFWCGPHADRGPTRRLLPHAGRVYLVEDRTEPRPLGAPRGVFDHVRYQRWWVNDPATKTFRLAAARTPPVLAVAPSSHYGLLAVVEDEPYNRHTLAAVAIAPPAAPAK